MTLGLKGFIMVDYDYTELAVVGIEELEEFELYENLEELK